MVKPEISKKKIKMILWISSILIGITILIILDSFINLFKITNYLGKYSYLAPYDTLAVLLLVNITLTIIAKIKSKRYTNPIRRWASINLIITLLFFVLIFGGLIFLIGVLKASPL
ncbi:MAG TPA: hypothetical protein VJJ21_05090 [Candidatus Nanoarchaeia archaeon]|nr:hypothetical protein [Candidatus Nanoarchaeia archaeon]